MDGVERGEYRPLVSFADTTMDLARRRVNQTVQALSGKLSCLANSLFCISFPCSCFCSGVDVEPTEDVIVSRWGIPTDILREPGSYCCFNPIGLETKSVSMRPYVRTITNLKVPDATGTPLYVSANVGYQVIDALAATYLADNSERFMYEQAKSVLHEIVSQHGTASRVRAELKRTLQERVRHVGIQINSFQITNLAYSDELQKLFLAKQEAIAYINARKVIAEAACDIVKKAVESLQEKQILLSETQKEQLVSDLILMITSQGDMTLRFFQSDPL